MRLSSQPPHLPCSCFDLLLSPVCSVREVTVHACSTAAERELHSSLFSIDWYLGCFARLSCNSFSVCDDELRPVGSALFPTVAMLNHSCLPNAVAMFSFAGVGGGVSGSGSVQVKVRAIRRIHAGEEVCISYIGLAQPRSARQRTLAADYHFACGCARCLQEHDTHRNDADPKAREAWIRNKNMDAIKCQHAWKRDPRNIPPPQPQQDGAAEITDALQQTQISSTSAAAASPAASSAALSAAGSSLASAASATPAAAFADALSAARCDGILLSNSAQPGAPCCSRCGLEHNLAFIQERMAAEVLPLMALAQEAVRQLEHAKNPRAQQQQAQQQDHQTALRTTRAHLEASLAALDKAYQAPAFALMTCLDQLLTACIDLGDWEAAQRAAAASLPFYDVYYQGLAHPLLALQLLSHAKLSWLLQRPAEALRSWKRALPILQVTHGPTHALVQQVREAIPPAEMEAAHERSTSRQIKA